MFWQTWFLFGFLYGRCALGVCHIGGYLFRGFWFVVLSYSAASTTMSLGALYRTRHTLTPPRCRALFFWTTHPMDGRQGAAWTYKFLPMTHTFYATLGVSSPPDFIVAVRMSQQQQHAVA